MKMPRQAGSTATLQRGQAQRQQQATIATNAQRPEPTLQEPASRLPIQPLLQRHQEQTTVLQHCAIDLKRRDQGRR